MSWRYHTQSVPVCYPFRPGSVCWRLAHSPRLQCVNVTSKYLNTGGIAVEPLMIWVADTDITEPNSPGGKRVELGKKSYDGHWTQFTLVQLVCISPSFSRVFL